MNNLEVLTKKIDDIMSQKTDVERYLLYTNDETERNHFSNFLKKLTLEMNEIMDQIERIKYG